MNRTKKTLLTSALSLLLCCAMLVGTTFAWFTDSVTSANNKIISGNLDLEVYYATQDDVVDGEVATWHKLTADSKVFKEGALYEPGYTEVVYFKYVNEGTLAFQYKMYTDIISEKAGINVDDELFTLSDYIQAYAKCDLDYQFYAFEDREDALNPAGAPAVWHDTLNNAAGEASDDDYVATPSGDNPLSLDHWQWLEPDEETYETLVLFMPTTVGNEANFKNEELRPEINLGISVVATQYNWTEESDSFDHNYDADAEYPEKDYPAPKDDINLSDLFAAGETASFANTTINGTITATEVYAAITLENVTGETQIVLDAMNTIILEGCDFTVADGEYLIIDNTNDLTTQLMFRDVTINGVEVNETTIKAYLNGVEWAYAY